jgi:putative flippase GtrA
MNRTLTVLSNMFTNLDITDMETCYKLFKREIIQSIDLREDRFGFEPEVTAKLSQIKCRVYECAITYVPRTYEEGKKINWKDGVWALYCILHYSAHCAPLPMQLIIYFVIGTVCAIVNVALFGALYNRDLQIGWSIATAFVTAAALNYLLCILILFRHKARWNTTGEIIAYITTVCIMGLADYGMTIGLTAMDFSPTLSKTIATAVGFFGNFLLRRFLVFPERRVVQI